MQINEKISDQNRIEEPEASVITNYRIYVKRKNKYTQETDYFISFGCKYRNGNECLQLFCLLQKPD